MPRPRNPDGREPKSRSRNGCWSCKARKVKCTEERPSCAKCVKGGYKCDYGIRLNWDGRRSKRPHLKAVQLGEGVMLDGIDFADDGGQPDDGLEAETSFRQLPLPQPIQGTDSSPPSTASSASSMPLTAKGSGQSLSFMPVHVPSGPVAPSSRSSKAVAASTTKAELSFQNFTPATASSLPTTFRFEVQTSAAPVRRASASRAKRTPRVADTARASLSSVGADTSLATDDVRSVSSSVGTADSRRLTMKRPRLDSDVSEKDFAWQWPISPSAGSGSTQSVASPRQTVFPSITSARAAGEVSSPRPSDDSQSLASPHTANTLLQLQAASDFRRLSVSSLLSGPVDLASVSTPPTMSAGPDSPLEAAAGRGEHRSSGRHNGRHEDRHFVYYYGIDCGMRDLDLGTNDDANATSGVAIDAGNYEPPRDRGQPPLEEDSGHDRGGYYTNPVAVRIPRALGQLPPKLTENPMNMLYFHHFINHTARILVPHDDPRSNPFRTILPQMALMNDNLLSLLLAYSAAHRAHVLCQPEPAMRIALWVQDIFPALRKALDDHKKKISNANVATAIMLASLAILSPTTFGYSIPWQTHLMLARQIIAARPEGLRVDHHSTLEGQVCSFLWSWFAYIDVLGGLSGGPTDASPAWILDYKVYNPQDDDEIDCIMGFTTRCVYILSQIAELVRACEPERLRLQGTGSEAWTPSEDLVLRVESLKVDVNDSRVQVPRPCAHLHRTGDIFRWDRKEMEATNEAYHWAALVHLERRVLGKPSDHPDVQGPCLRIVECIDQVRFGGTAENCLLFPLFTAGCELTDVELQKGMLKRMISIEGTAMMQVSSAMALMKRAWSTRKPWETLLTSEFIG
ncbi:c6 zinc finger domain containing protein [Grosmannia clavigera kw1407]|uniref:C6 zinc finger domain containing protein n=1 Tax=Grosmannia clavigera (strain kw1407 / UAMH 11150) TaxID=655863 RepID=F0X9A4_GROCL|nr:c6 zinc finger domain containing protein [Grosmannia clavigera kw1407]EFX05317.1 c6 zinc finger domain containing protein [Grosmannia clavigera kw1407]